MRFFTTIIALAVTATVSAQSSTLSVATATSASLSPQQTCLAACDRADICCQAACVNVPCPNEADINATTSCAGQCVQGNGTQAETEAYAACQSRCISSYFLSATGTAGSTRTASAASATGTGASASTSGASGSASRTGSSTGSASASAASSTSNSAPETRVALAGAGLFGLIIAGLAL